MTDEREPTLAKVLDAALAKALGAMSVSMPAQVTGVNVSGQQPTVDVLTCIGRTIVEENREANDPPVAIAGVPIVFPGSGVYRLTFPISVGDYVLLVVADRSTEEFVARGGSNIPAHLHSHKITDCFAIPGVIAPPQQLTAVSTSKMVLGKIDGTAHAPAARQGDGVGNGTLAFVATAGAGALTGLTVTYTPGDGSTPQTQVMTVATPTPPQGPLVIKEKITAGSSSVEITS